MSEYSSKVCEVDGRPHDWLFSRSVIEDVGVTLVVSLVLNIPDVGVPCAKCSRDIVGNLCLDPSLQKVSLKLRRETPTN